MLDGFAFDRSRVTEGFINLADDVRQVPLGGPETGSFESFAQAVAKADGGRAINASEGHRLPYGSFIWPEDFAEQGKRFPAGAMLEVPADTLEQAIGHKTVLIGAAWSGLAYNRGAPVDSHASPVGRIPGVYLHANYAAAILDNRTYHAAYPWFGTAVEVLLVAFIALVFAVDPASHLRWALVGAGAVCLTVVAYVFWQNFGIFFEPVIPIILLIMHWLYDEYHDMRVELESLRQKVH